MTQPETALETPVETSAPRVDPPARTGRSPGWKIPDEVLRKYPNIGRVLNLELPVIVVLAEKTCTLEDVLSFMEGSVIVFKKHNSQPLDILVNDRKIGEGKTIKIGERFGIHVREVGSAEEILANLQDPE